MHLKNYIDNTFKNQYNRKVTKEEIKKLNDKVDNLQKSIDKLSARLYKHIKFIDSTYDGLKNPIEAARKWLRK